MLGENEPSVVDAAAHVQATATRNRAMSGNTTASVSTPIAVHVGLADSQWTELLSGLDSSRRRAGDERRARASGRGCQGCDVGAPMRLTTARHERIRDATSECRRRRRVRSWWAPCCSSLRSTGQRVHAGPASLLSADHPRSRQVRNDRGRRRGRVGDRLVSRGEPAAADLQVRRSRSRPGRVVSRRGHDHGEADAGREPAAPAGDDRRPDGSPQPALV